MKRTAGGKNLPFSLGPSLWLFLRPVPSCPCPFVCGSMQQPASRPPPAAPQKAPRRHAAAYSGWHASCLPLKEWWSEDCHCDDDSDPGLSRTGLENGTQGAGSRNKESRNVRRACSSASRSSSQGYIRQQTDPLVYSMDSGHHWQQERLPGAKHQWGHL